MIFLMNDYSEGIHPKILEAMVQSNGEQQVGYGKDEHTKNAQVLIKKFIGREDVDVHLLVAGTQTNKVALAAFLKPYEAVISSNLGHIAVHETGAIEATGHKIIEMPSLDAKLTPRLIQEAVDVHMDEHMVLPKVVYLSNATEMGCVYTKKELEEIRKVCDENELYLYLDGARLAVALTCEKNDMTIYDIARLCDAFYLGGTKNGAMIGEALVICNENLKSHMRYFMKQNGALLAKGRFIGIQFEVLMKDGLFLEIAKYTNQMARNLKEGIRKLGLQFIVESDSNLIFVALPNEVHAQLKEHCHYEIEGKFDEEHIRARFVTSFATPKEDVEKFLVILNKLTKVGESEKKCGK